MTHPPSLKAEAAADGRREFAEELTHLALTAYRDGTLQELLGQRPKVTRWIVRKWLAPVSGTAGDVLAAAPSTSQAVALLLEWAVVSLRPDAALNLAGIGAVEWLERTSWRPMLAVACHFGFLRVPEFAGRYRRRADETAADNLCGLWNVGPSTFYRYLSKGRQQIGRHLFSLPSDASLTVSLRRYVQAYCDEMLGTEDSKRAWHEKQSASSQARGDIRSALWHALQAGDAVRYAKLLSARRIEACHPEVDLHLAEWEERGIGARELIELCLAKAAMWSTRHLAEKERAAYEQAVQVATAARDKLLLGMAYGALGKYYEARDVDRAFAAYDDSVRFLNEASAGDSENAAEDVNEAYLTNLVRLAWLYVTRNDARSRPLLDRAEVLRCRPCRTEEPVALLEQCWGEYWRRAGELGKALEHKHRALNIFERLNHQRSVLATYLNLSLVCGEAREFDRAIAYAKQVIEVSRRTEVELEVVIGAHANLGATYFWQGNMDDAIREYREALSLCEFSGLRAHGNRMHYNLAEAHYKRYQLQGRHEDEAEGDRHALLVMKAGPAEADANLREASRQLKAEILGQRGLVDRLLPDEYAAHFDEMAEVQRQRAALVLPLQPAERIRAHIAIAKAYLTIAAREGEAARALTERFNLEDEFALDFAQLKATFEQELFGREQKLNAQWRDTIGDLLSEERRSTLLKRLIRGEALSKSTYAQLCGVGLATASKHLALLAERGLLAQTGRGPTTRYSLVDVPAREKKGGA